MAKYLFELLAGDHTNLDGTRYSTGPGKRCKVPNDARLDVIFPRKFRLLEGKKFKAKGSPDDEEEDGVKHDDGLSAVKQSDGGMTIELPADADPDELEEGQIKAQQLRREEMKLAKKKAQLARPKHDRESDEDEDEEDEEVEGEEVEEEEEEEIEEEDVTKKFVQAKKNDLTVVKGEDGFIVRDGKKDLHKKAFKTDAEVKQFVKKHLEA